MTSHSRPTAIIVALLVILSACATSGRVGETRYHEADFDIVWAAAIGAVLDIGARIRVENRAAGAISASMNVDAIGTAVALEISVDRLLTGAEVQVRAIDRHDSEPTDMRIDELRYLESQYLDLVDQGVMAQRGRSRGTRRPY